MKTITSTVSGILCALVLLWAVACHDDDDKGTDPVQPKDYPVYISDVNWSRVFIYYPISRRLDSVEINGLLDLTASADGTLLYGAARGGVAVLDATTFSVVTELPYVAHWSVAVSRDGRMIGIAGEGLYILSTSDYHVVYSDTVQCENGVFSYDCSRFYCAVGWGTGGAGDTYIVDFSDTLNPVTNRIEPPAGGVLWTVPTHDNKKLLRYSVIQKPLCSFDVYDTESDSVLFTDYLVPGYGEIALSVDGKYAFYTNCGVTGSDYPPPPGTFTIFDLEANSIQDTISKYDYAPPVCGPPGRMAVTPDGRWLVFLAGTQIGYFQILLFDLKENTFVDYVDFSNNSSLLVSVTTQLIP